MIKGQFHIMLNHCKQQTPKHLYLKSNMDREQIIEFNSLFKRYFNCLERVGIVGNYLYF